jgi:hypothetical protein
MPMMSLRPENTRRHPRILWGLSMGTFPTEMAIIKGRWKFKSSL